MLILLKLLCFFIWLMIMFYLVIGNNSPMADYREVVVKLQDEENLEMTIRSALTKLKKKDRLIIEDQYGFLKSRQNMFIFSRFVRKNPSIIYSYASENVGY
jgi:hypothetical protein